MSSPTTTAAPAPPRVAVTCAGDPSDPTAYSGFPAELLKGLTEVGAQAVPLRGELGSRAQIWLERALVALALRPADLLTPSTLRAKRGSLRMTRGTSRAMPAARAWGARRGLRELMPLDGVLQCGVGFDLPDHLAVVTVEDATLRQVTEGYAWPWMGDVTPATLERMQGQLRQRYARAKACSFMSHWAARSAIEDYGVDRAKVHVVGVGRNHEPPCPDRDWSVPRALFVGFDWQRKNGAAVMRAFARLRGIRPEARLDIVGAHPPLQADGVRGHGPLSLSEPSDRARIEGLFASATFFVMPSLHEPAGIVYAEAQAAGLASIATTSGGASTIVGDAGILVDPLDEQAIAEAMLRLADPMTAQRMGAVALARSPLFTWRAVAERLIRALEPPGVDTSRLAPFLSEQPAAAASRSPTFNAE